MHCGAEFHRDGEGPVEHDPGGDSIDVLLEGDLPAFAAHLDRNELLRTVVAVVYGVATWYLLASVVLPAGTPEVLALFGGVVVALAGLQHDEGPTLLSRGLYYVAGSLLAGRVLVPLVLFGGGTVSTTQLLVALVHAPTLVAAGLLVYAGRWVAEQVREGEDPHPHAR